MTDTPLPIIDGHNDVIGPICAGRDFFKKNSEGHLDLPRMREGGFAGGFFAIMAPGEPGYTRAPNPVTYTSPGAEGPPRMANPVGIGYAQQVAFSRMAAFRRLERASEGAVRIVTDATQLRDCVDSGTLGMIIHFEGAEPIDPGFNSLEIFHAAGLRSMGLCWSRPTMYAHGVHFAFPASPDTGPGLTPLGKDLVRECNAMRIMIDLSHINEQGFWDVAATSKAPLVATHSNAHAICAATRNLTDKQLDAIRDSDGMVGVNFGVGFLREDGKSEADTPMETVIKHFAYLVDRLGIERVGFGSDFDGTRIPGVIGDATGLPKVVQALRDHGFGDAELRKLGHENWLRVLSLTW